MNSKEGKNLSLKDALDRIAERSDLEEKSDEREEARNNYVNSDEYKKAAELEEKVNKKYEEVLAAYESPSITDDEYEALLADYEKLLEENDKVHDELMESEEWEKYKDVLASDLAKELIEKMKDRDISKGLEENPLEEEIKEEVKLEIEKEIRESEDIANQKDSEILTENIEVPEEKREQKIVESVNQKDELSKEEINKRDEINTPEETKEEITNTQDIDNLEQINRLEEIEANAIDEDKEQMDPLQKAAKSMSDAVKELGENIRLSNKGEFVKLDEMLDIKKVEKKEFKPEEIDKNKEIFKTNIEVSPGIEKILEKLRRKNEEVTKENKEIGKIKRPIEVSSFEKGNDKQKEVIVKQTEMPRQAVEYVEMQDEAMDVKKENVNVEGYGIESEKKLPRIDSAISLNDILEDLNGISTRNKIEKVKNDLELTVGIIEENKAIATGKVVPNGISKEEDMGMTKNVGYENEYTNFKEEPGENRWQRRCRQEINIVDKKTVALQIVNEFKRNLNDMSDVKNFNIVCLPDGKYRLQVEKADKAQVDTYYIDRDEFLNAEGKYKFGEANKEELKELNNRESFITSKLPTEINKLNTYSKSLEEMKNVMGKYVEDGDKVIRRKSGKTDELVKEGEGQYPKSRRGDKFKERENLVDNIGKDGNVEKIITYVKNRQMEKEKLAEQKKGMEMSL
ncbi:MAG: hypothetical protein J6Y29_05835 [Clostridiales bacterium]|nr:hypothetical protein [Clostridiales bacterium]